MALAKNIEYLRIRLASPERIRAWGEHTLPDGQLVGEVTKAETINYRTLKPEMDGLFCERIFGPVKDWECHCGRYKGPTQATDKQVMCPNCGVEITSSRVRRQRLGYIQLASPVSHVWYLKGIPSYMAVLLNMPRKWVESIVYCTGYLKTDLTNPCTLPVVPWDDFQSMDIDAYMMDLTTRMEHPFGWWGQTQGNQPVEHAIAGEAIYQLLESLDLVSLGEEIQQAFQEIQDRNPYRFGEDPEERDRFAKRKATLMRRLKLVNHFIRTGASPEWMVLTVLPVLPPDLRPMVQLDGGRFATSDLNDLYRRVITRNNRLQRLQRIMAPDILIRSEKRMLQEAVDALLDNGRHGKPVKGPNNRPLKSLSDIIKGKQGRFRQNLLGKRVDYSGRSVIVVGPHLQLHQCGLPREMAIELFQPFVIHRLIKKKLAQNIRSAKKLIQQGDRLIWETLTRVMRGHPVLLNRAPTLHRLGIQAFDPILVEGRAIHLHPLVCPAFNADFDGDQMAVHIPLSSEAQSEARLLMLASNNLLSPATGQPILVPSQDMVLGCYYLTTQPIDPQKGTGQYFTDLEDAIRAYHNGQIDLHAPIWVRWNGSVQSGIVEDEPLEIRLQSQGNSLHIYSTLQVHRNHVGHSLSQYVRTTPGRILFNQVFQKFANHPIPQEVHL
uniref:DNA-directed RNA polymerase subunit beta' n=1 Tax=Nephroselmis pyriformis TaxID=156128 RepID=A0A8A2H8T0_9CHLO|nr:RNA polymerase beta' subunit [Nephroselmis pyriformis]QSV37305.1 RNA polymerase beta' subunit [Nephroselmis pyriformis]